LASPHISNRRQVSARHGRTLKPASQITDRAKRYRAQSDENRPANPKMCGYCGSRENVGVDHIDGNEAHGEPQNLMWACKSCNGKKSNLMRRASIGTLTRQYNPRGSRTEQMRAYGNAIKVMRGEFDGDVSAAMATIKGTPASLRSAYTSRTWVTRKAFYGPSGRANPGGDMRSKKKRRNSATDHLDRSPSYHPKGGTSTEVRSPTSTSTEVRSPTETSTSTSTDAYTAGNVTVTGGAGAGATTVKIHQHKMPESDKGSERPQRKPWAGVPAVHAAGKNPRGRTLAQWKTMRARQDAKLEKIRREREARAAKRNPGTGLVTTALAHSAAGRKATSALKKLFSKKKNPAAQASAMYELFHGMPPDEVIEIVERVHVHSNLTSIGTLTSMLIQTESGRQFNLNGADPDTAKKSDVVYVTINERGDQIFFRGGDQEIPKRLLEQYGFKAADFREHMIIGAVLELTYRTKKKFEKDGKELVDFYHTLGKEHSGGVVPMLVYNPRDPSIALYGGRYKVLPKRGDIGASPGIAG
jgi:hypothetical protein